MFRTSQQLIFFICTSSELLLKMSYFGVIISSKLTKLVTEVIKMNKKDNKLSVMMEKETLDKIEYYRYKNGKRSKSQAALELIKIGLDNLDEKEED